MFYRIAQEKVNKLDKLTGKIGQYPVPTYEDFEAACDWQELDDFAILLMHLCSKYAKKLDDYEKRYEDDGK